MSEAWNGLGSFNGGNFTTTNINTPLVYNTTINIDPRYVCAWDTTNNDACIVVVGSNNLLSVYRLSDYQLVSGFNSLDVGVGDWIQVRTITDYIFVYGTNGIIKQIDNTGAIVWTQTINDTYPGASANPYPNLSIDETNLYLTIIATGTNSGKKLLLLSIDQATGNINWDKLLRDNYNSYTPPFHSAPVAKADGNLYLHYAHNLWPYRRYLKVDAITGATVWEIRAAISGADIDPLGNYEIPYYPAKVSNGLFFRGAGQGISGYFKVAFNGFVGNYFDTTRIAVNNNFVYGYANFSYPIKKYTIDGSFIKMVSIGASGIDGIVVDNNNLIITKRDIIYICDQDLNILSQRELDSNEVVTGTLINDSLAASQGTLFLLSNTTSHEGTGGIAALRIYNNSIVRKDLSISYNLYSPAITKTLTIQYNLYNKVLKDLTIQYNLGSQDIIPISNPSVVNIPVIELKWYSTEVIELHSLKIENLTQTYTDTVTPIYASGIPYTSGLFPEGAISVSGDFYDLGTVPGASGEGVIRYNASLPNQDDTYNWYVKRADFDYWYTGYQFTVNIPDSVATITLEADPLTVPISGSTTITATLKEASGNTVAAGITVDFTTTQGQLSTTTGVTDTNGQIQTTLSRIDTFAGDVVVTASSQNITSTIRVRFAYYALDRLEAVSLVTKLLADGVAFTNVTGKLYDINDNLILDGYNVDAVIGTGSLDAATKALMGGQVIFKVTAPAVAGTTQFIASVGAIQDTIDFEWVIGRIVKIVVDPNSAILTSTGSEQFSCIGYDNKNNPMPIDPFWELEGGHGTLDGTGLYQADTIGRDIAKATYNNLVAWATIDIVAGDPVSINIDPNSLDVPINTNTQLKCTALDTDNNVLDVTKDVVWTTDAGIITGQGYFTAQGTAKTDGYIKAAYGDLTDQIDVDVIPAVPQKVSVFHYNHPLDSIALAYNMERKLGETNSDINFRLRQNLMYPSSSHNVGLNNELAKNLSTAGLASSVITEKGITISDVDLNVVLESLVTPNSYITYISLDSEFVCKLDNTLQETNKLKFIMKPGLIGEVETVSFEASTLSNYYLKNKNNRIVLALNDGSEEFKAEASFYKRKGLHNDIYNSLESYSNPSYYIGDVLGELYLINRVAHPNFQIQAEFNIRTTFKIKDLNAVNIQDPFVKEIENWRGYESCPLDVDIDLDSIRLNNKRLIYTATLPESVVIADIEQVLGLYKGNNLVITKVTKEEKVTAEDFIAHLINLTFLKMPDIYYLDEESKIIYLTKPYGTITSDYSGTISIKQKGKAAVTVNINKLVYNNMGMLYLKETDTEEVLTINKEILKTTHEINEELVIEYVANSGIRLIPSSYNLDIPPGEYYVLSGNAIRFSRDDKKQNKQVRIFYKNKISYTHGIVKFPLHDKFYVDDPRFYLKEYQALPTGEWQVKPSIIFSGIVEKIMTPIFWGEFIWGQNYWDFLDKDQSGTGELPGTWDAEF